MHSVLRSLFYSCLIASLALSAVGCASGSLRPDLQKVSDGAHTRPEKIPPYHARFARAQPVVAVVGDNRGTELTDYVIPFGVLAQSGVAQVIALSTQSGPLSTFTDMGKPSFKIASEATVAEFDARFPDGADYVVVPATRDSPEVINWIASQIKKGATIVSICNGAMVVAMTGLMDGHRATAHWSTEDHRRAMHPTIHWVKNARYVADRNWISGAGVSAAMPTSIALVEAIGGHDRAAALAKELAAGDWNAPHSSDAFHPAFGVNLTAFAETMYLNQWFHSTDRLGIAIAPGVNEISLALTVDAYSSTGRSQAFTVAASKAPMRSLHGLTIIPDFAARDVPRPMRSLPVLDAVLPGQALDRALGGIARSYGATNAYGVALLMEYPWVRQ